MAPVTVFFRLYRTEDRHYVKWFKFEFDGGGESDNDGKVVEKFGGRLGKPLSRVKQPLDSTVVGVRTLGRTFIYSIGGGRSRRVERLDTAVADTDTDRAGRWEECPPMKEKRTRPQVVVLGSKIFVFGGYRNPDFMDAHDEEFHTWAEFLDTEGGCVDGWQSLIPDLTGRGSSSLINLLNPGREKNFTFHVAKFNSSEILLSSRHSPSYIFNPANNSLREASVNLRIGKNYYRDAAPPIILFPVAADRPIEVSFLWEHGNVFGQDMAEKDDCLSYVGCNDPIHSGLPYMPDPCLSRCAYIRSDCLDQPIKDRLHVFWAVEEHKKNRITLYFRQISYTLSSSVSPPLMMDGQVTYTKSYTCPGLSVGHEFYLLDGLLL